MGETARLALTQEAVDARAASKATSDKIFQRADAAGKGLISLATLLVGYVGVSHATDLFPIPSGWLWLAVVAVALLTLMFILAISMGWRFSHAVAPVVMGLDPDKNQTLSHAERAIVKEVYRRHVEDTDFQTLTEYDAHRRTIAKTYERYRLGDRQPNLPFSRSSQILAEVKCAQQRAVVHVLRLRVGRATSGKLTIAIVVAFAICAFGFGVAANKLANERTSTSNQFAIIKQCGEAAATIEAHAAITLALPKECMP
ncbi:hypothetical protein QN239_07065 [Mycolicibacterium sp. Y3]